MGKKESLITIERPVDAATLRQNAYLEEAFSLGRGATPVKVMRLDGVNAVAWNVTNTGFDFHPTALMSFSGQVVSRENIEKVINEIEPIYDVIGKPPKISLTVQNKDVEEILTERGYKITRVGVIWLGAENIENNIFADLPAVKNFEIKRIGRLVRSGGEVDEAEVTADFVDVYFQARPDANAETHQYLPGRIRDGIKNKTMTGFVLYSDGKALSCGQIIHGRNIDYLVRGSTIPDYRNKGCETYSFAQRLNAIGQNRPVIVSTEVDSVIKIAEKFGMQRWFTETQYTKFPVG